MFYQPLFDYCHFRGRDRMVVVSSNPVHDAVYSTKHYVIKFVSDLRQVGGFLWVLHQFCQTQYLKHQL